MVRPIKKSESAVGFCDFPVYHMLSICVYTSVYRMSSV